MIASRRITLLVTDAQIQVLDSAGEARATLPLDPEAWTPALREALPRGCAVQLILADAPTAITCQETPALRAREAREVSLRLAPGGPLATAHLLDTDPGAEGGHVLWIASHPRRELAGWLEALRTAGASRMVAIPWQRAFLAGAGRMDPAGALFLALEAGSGRLLFFRGRNLRYLRGFVLPPEPDARMAAMSRELSRLLQFAQQKHWGGTPRTLAVVGMAGPAPGLSEMAQALGLKAEILAPDLPAFLQAGAARERPPLDLVPLEFKEARRRRVFRAVVWTAALGILLLGGATKAFFLRHEAELVVEAKRAEAARDHRKILLRGGEEAARLRFGLLRVRWAEARQARAMERLEALGLRIFKVPEGVELHKVEILQAPGDEVSNRFTVTGVALTRKGFSMGTLAEYFGALAAYPGMTMQPLKDIAVEDGERREQAQTRFTFGGTAP